MKKQKLEKLEALRGFAALYVVFFHALPQQIYLWGVNVGVLFRFGPESVILFFILSGFVIKYTYEKSRDKSFKHYFIRRFIRLYIPMLFIFVLGYAIKCIKSGGIADPEIVSLFGNLFMLQDVATQKPNVLFGVYLANGPLWSLSYEWWFYMLFFVLASNIKIEKLDYWVSIISITAAATYIIYPFFINRLLMYFSIWYIGAIFARVYLNNEQYSIKRMAPFIGVLLTITLLMAINLYLKNDLIKTYQFPYSAHPIIEFRHFAFSIIVLIASVLWQNAHWFAFDKLFGIFKYIAPCSYVIYISHTYLVVDATYLNFIHNQIIEFFLYLIIMIAFSYTVEVYLYNKIKTKIIG